MKAILEFTLPEERQEFEMAVNGSSYVAALGEFSQLLREKDKYSDNQKTSWEEVRKLFHEILVDRKIDLDYLA